MRIAIIGCGYVGSALGARLVELGHQVTGTTTSASRLRELVDLGIRPVLTDVAELRSHPELFADQNALFLTIAAGKHGRDYRDVYLRGVRAVLQAARDTGIGQVIYTSSTSVYGQHDGEWVDEDSPIEPASETGRILRQAELELLEGAAQQGLIGSVLRLAGIYGPGRGPANRIRFCAGQERTDGRAWVNLIHREDIVTALVALLSRPWGGILNWCDGHPVLRRMLYDRVIARTGLAPIRWSDAAGPVDRGKRIRNDLARRVLACELKYPCALESPEFALP